MIPDNSARLQLFVGRLATRSVLEDEEREAILAWPIRAVDVRARTDFVQENEEISYSCFIASGVVGRYGETREGKRQITAFHIEGDMADLHSAVRPVGVGGLSALCEHNDPTRATRCDPANGGTLSSLSGSIFGATACSTLQSLINGW